MLPVPQHLRKPAGEDAKSGGVWYARTLTYGPSSTVTSVTPGKLGLSGASGYGAVLSR
ncbi:hypothetical protein [Streptomyces sp. NPDC002855]|uniref:hypothetical protein n=1 Tax=Streptomyces sp. NPDC002855 TaxID=3154437 RepID=UPI003324DF91